MREKTVQELLEGAFPISGKPSWEDVATSELKKGAPLESLNFTTGGGLVMKPIYASKDVTELRYLNSFDLGPSPADNGHLGAQSWHNLPKVTVVDEIQSNRVAVEHLMNGADGLYFDLGKREVNLRKLLTGIEWQHCHLSFANLAPSFENELRHYFATNKSPLAGILWDIAPAVQKELLNFVPRAVRCGGIKISSSSPEKEISQALFLGTLAIDELLSAGFAIERAVEQVAFSLACRTELMPEAAKLKSLRILWYQVVRAYEFSSYNPNDLNIHSRSEFIQSEKFQPHANILKGTLSAWVAICGGSNLVTIEPEREDDKMLDRIARNVSNLMREESHLNTVDDPLAGSYAFDTIVDGLCREAWSEFQQRISTTR